MLTVNNEEVKLEESLPKPSSFQSLWVRSLLVLLLAACFVALVLWRSPVDAYTKEVLSLAGEPVKGRSIFVMNCVACHGQWGAGKVGPSLQNVSSRLSKSKLVHQVVSGETPPMPQFQPEPQEMADLLKYLESM